MKKILLLCLFYMFLNDAATKRNTLELLHIIFRHGDRTPELFYPKDPYLNATFDPVGRGQVTNSGKLKLYKLGETLRKRYKTFLEPFTIETVDARSTEYNRTKVSLQLVLASLFPPQRNLIWKKNFNWQPIPYNYWNLKNDHILGNAYRNCPKFKQLYFEFLNSTEGLKMYEDFKDLGQYVANNSGLEPTAKNLFELYFTLQMEAEFGLVLPAWTQFVYPEPMIKLVSSEYKARSATTELKRLSAGFLLKKIIKDTEKRIKKFLPPKRKLFLYSGHEYNLTYLLQVLGVVYPHIPPYAAYIAVEIHKIREIRKVKIFYQDYKERNPRRIKLPNCGDFCSFVRFTKLYKHYLPKSGKECKL